MTQPARITGLAAVLVLAAASLFGQTPRRIERTAEGFRLAPFQAETCVSCDGKKVAKCTSCDGGALIKKRERCHECRNKKKAPCRPCGGTGKTWDPMAVMPCPRCEVPPTIRGLEPPGTVTGSRCYCDLRTLRYHSASRRTCFSV